MKLRYSAWLAWFLSALFVAIVVGTVAAVAFSGLEPDGELPGTVVPLAVIAGGMTVLFLLFSVMSWAKIDDTAIQFRGRYGYRVLHRLDRAERFVIAHERVHIARADGTLEPTFVRRSWVAKRDWVKLEQRLPVHAG